MTFKIGVHDTFETEWYQYKRKDGKLGAWHRRFGPWYTPLFTCEYCGSVSTPKNVCYRNDCHLYDLWSKTPLLCTGCWNKVKPIVKQWEQIRELKLMSNRIKRAKYDGKKNN